MANSSTRVLHVPTFEVNPFEINPILPSKPEEDPEQRKIRAPVQYDERTADPLTILVHSRLGKRRVGANGKVLKVGKKNWISQSG